jgi:hypothetical protein
MMAMENFVIHPFLISNIFDRKRPGEKHSYSIALCFWKVLELAGAVDVIPLPIGEPIKTGRSSDK